MTQKERVIAALNRLSDYFDGDHQEQCIIDSRLDVLRQEIKDLPD
jgi:hypothetical protein